MDVIATEADGNCGIHALFNDVNGKQVLERPGANALRQEWFDALLAPATMRRIVNAIIKDQRQTQGDATVQSFDEVKVDYRKALRVIGLRPVTTDPERDLS